MSLNHPPEFDVERFRPPEIPTLVRCCQCGREYESYLIQWHQERLGGRWIGFWACPTEGCDGQGFGFDIFPLDPDYVGEDGEPMGQPFQDFCDLDEDNDQTRYGFDDEIDPGDSWLDGGSLA
ncbi:MAG: hypothetical protein ACOCTI_07735 [Phycisphaeraceae bacterium]